MIVTVRDGDTDKKKSVQLGADDYVTKPFSLVELESRIKANIRRATVYDKEQGEATHNHLDSERFIQVQDLTIDIESRCVRRGEQNLNFTYTEFEILKLLASHPNRAFSKEQIYDLIWKEPYYENENVLNAHMNRMRGKLKKEAECAKKDIECKDKYIKTLWGIGYKIIR